VRQPDVAAVSGLVVPRELETSAQVLFEQSGSGLDRAFVPLTFERIGRFRVLRRAPGDGSEQVRSLYATGEFGIGSNMAFRVAVLRAVGGFDEALGALAWLDQRVWVLAGFQAAVGVMMLGMTLVLLPRAGLVAVGWAYLVTQAMAAAVVTPFTLRRMRRGRHCRPRGKHRDGTLAASAVVARDCEPGALHPGILARRLR
jgi:hypothetical protein